jgi:cytochrome c
MVKINMLQRCVVILLAMTFVENINAQVAENRSDPFVQCLACHSTKRGESHFVGPNLFGVYGARIASQKGFVYSKALTFHKSRWTDVELKAWLESPQTYAPGTKMAFGGIKDPELQQQVIDTMKSLR